MITQEMIEATIFLLTLHEAHFFFLITRSHEIFSVTLCVRYDRLVVNLYELLFSCGIQVVFIGCVHIWIDVSASERANNQAV